MPGHLAWLVCKGKARVVGKDKFGRKIWEVWK
jgi:hypothetical protein